MEHPSPNNLVNEQRLSRQDIPGGEYNSYDEDYESGPSLSAARVLLGHKFKILLLMILGTGIGFYWHMQTPVSYQSSAQLQLIHHRPVLGPNSVNERTVPSDLIDTHIVLMRSPIIIDRAVEKDDTSVASPNQRRSAAAIASGLTVRRSSQSQEILDLSYRSNTPDECQAVLASMIEAYVQYLAESQADSTSDELRYMTQLKDDVAEELAQLEEEYAEFRKNASLIWSGDQGQNVHALRLSEIEAKRSTLLVERSLIESELTTVMELRNKAGRDTALYMIHHFESQRRRIPSQSRPSSINSPIAVSVEESLLLEKLGPNHPKVQAILRRVRLEETLAQSHMQNRGEDPQPVDVLQMFEDGMNHELEIKDQQLARLDQLFQQEQAHAKSLAIDENTNRTMREAIERKKRVFETILTKLQSEELTKDKERISVRTILPPTSAAQITLNRNKSISAGATLGLLCGLALAALIELFDQRFHTGREVTQQLGVPVIGQISPMLPPGGFQSMSSFAPMLISLKQPFSESAEQFRRLRAALMIGLPGRNQVIQVTSPKPSDGKTTVVTNLAIAIAQTGKRCLLIDCDFQRPIIHEIFGLDQSLGIATILHEKKAISEAVHSQVIDNLDVLSTGNWLTRPAESLMSKEFALLIEKLRTIYDVILIDSSPVLSVSDPMAIASMVDQTIVVMQLQSGSRPMLKEVQEMFEVVGSRISGIVLNRHQSPAHSGLEPFLFTPLAAKSEAFMPRGMKS